MRGHKRTKETFIQDANKIHNHKYDYSKVDYVNTDTKVQIVCIEHGEFLQTPNEHLKGHGCPKCAKDKKRKTTEQFIQEASFIHKNKYDYSKVYYQNNCTKVCIICPIHGEFWQSPKKHLMGAQGCPRCNLYKGKKTKDVEHISFSTSVDLKTEFIQKAILKHSSKYDYSKVEYISSNTKVCIICPKHGEFWQTPHHHLEGRGCPKCGRKIVTTETYLEWIKLRYGNKYDYSKLNYINRKSPIIVTCKEHGDFEISPIAFLNNTNSEHCPICQTRKNILETKLFETLKEEFKNTKIIRNYHNYKILGKKEIDIYFPEWKIGIEYQGTQHFRSVDFFGGDFVFQKQLLRDIEKINDCINSNIVLLHFSYTKPPKTTNINYTVYSDVQELIDIIKQKKDG